MQYPNIPYIISSQYFEPTKKRELLLALPIENEDEYDGIVITQTNKGEMNGSNLEFTDTSIIIDKEETLNFKEFEICIDNDKSYLIIESTKKKIWCLPDNVITFLKMDISQINYALTVINKKPFILELETRNVCGQNQKINWKEELVIAKNEVSFNYIESSNEKDSLDESYFIKNESKYYIRDCYLHKDSNNIYVYSDMKIDEEKCDNLTNLLGFVKLGDEIVES